MISPLTLPATDTDAARMCAVTTADSPIVMLSFAIDFAVDLAVDAGGTFE